MAPERASHPAAKSRTARSAIRSGTRGSLLDPPRGCLPWRSREKRVRLGNGAPDPAEIIRIASSAGLVRASIEDFYLNDGTLDVPPGPGTAGGTLALPAEVGAVHLLSAQSHMHRHSVQQLATLVGDGMALYESDTWNEPPVKVYDPPLSLAAGAEITWKCDLDNDTSAHLTFGESAATNEMCVFTAFYYPAPDGKTVVGDVAVGKTFLTK